MATPTVDLSTLAQQIAGLSDTQALDLLSSIEALTLRAHAHKAAMAAAEAQRDTWASKAMCPCGKPPILARHVQWEQISVRLGVDAGYAGDLAGGLIASEGEYESPPPDADDVKKAAGDLWVSCGENDCEHGWTRIPGGYDGIVGWE